jgi:hypothetical protein
MSNTDKPEWEELESAAAKMFDVWIDGTELKWAKEAWRHLIKAGLTDATTVLAEHCNESSAGDAC